MSRHDPDRRQDAPRAMTRRQAMAKLGLAGVVAYVAPTLLTLSDASAHSRGSRTSLTSVRVRRRFRRKFVEKPHARFEFEARKKPRFKAHKHYHHSYYY